MRGRRGNGAVGSHKDVSDHDGIPAPDFADVALFSLMVIRRRFSDEELVQDRHRFARVFPAARRTMANYDSWPDRGFHPHTIAAQLGG